jgi:hypothetical protein
LRYTRFNDPQIAKQHRLATNRRSPAAGLPNFEPLAGHRRKAQAWLEIDLDTRLQFATGLVIRHQSPPARPRPDDGGWQQWPLRAGLRLQPPRPRRRRHARTGRPAGPPGHLALHAGRNLAALRVISEFDLHRDSRVSGQPVLRSTEISARNARRRCRRAKTNARSAAARLRHRRRRGRCSACGALPAPTAGKLLSGFLLTLASTGAHAGAALPDHAADGQRADPVPERQPIDWPLVSIYLGGLLGAALARLGAGLDPHLHPVAGFGAHRPRPAHHHLRTPAGPVAGVFRRQAHRRPDGADRQRNRPHQHLPLARPAQFRHRRADDRDDRRHPVHRSTRGWRWSPCCRCRSLAG